MNRVFISYCHEDGDFSDTLRSKLEAAGIPTWQDTDLYGGQQWRVEIDLAIRDAPAVIVVLSPESVRSDYVNYEWAFALGAGVNVVPVLLRAGTAALHPALQSRQFLDFSNRLSRPWDLLFRAVKGIGSQAPQTTVRVPAGAPPVLEEAARALDSMDEKQRSAALDTLEAMKSDVAIEVLAGATMHPIQKVRFRAAHILLEYGDKRALPAALEAIRTNYSSRTNFTMSFSLDTLGREALPELLSAMRDEDASVRSAAAKAVGRFGDPVAIPELTRLLTDEVSWVRRTAIDALSGFRDPSLLLPFQDAYRRADGTERDALRAAAALPDSAGECLLLEALKHPESEVRRTAIELLGKGATAAALEPLVNAMRDSEVSVRAAVAEVLDLFPNSRAVEVLVEALDDDNSEVRSQARRALAKMAGPAVVASAVNAVRDRERFYRNEAARLLGELGDPTVVPVLLEVLEEKDADSDLVKAAAASLGDLAKPGSPAVDALAKLLSDSRPGVVEVAVDALGSIRDPASVAPLAGLLNGENSDIQRSVDHALRSIGTQEARRVLVMQERRQRG